MPTERRRFVELDAFRGLAALWVVLFHVLLRYQDLYGGPVPEWLAGLLRMLSAPGNRFGELPVYWFFMISGFVIVWTLEGCRDWRDFAVSRASRLYPSYWAAASLTFLVSVLAPLPGQAATFGQYLVNLTMLQSFLGVPALDGAYWSLGVELLFYALMASLFVAGGMRHLPYACLAWALAALATHALAWGGIDVWWKVQRWLVLPYAHFLVAGIAWYEIWRGRRRVLFGAVLGVCFASMAFSYIARDVAACLVFLALFGLAVRGWLRWIAVAPLLWLGSVSYALYVCHEVVGMRAMRMLEGWGLPRLASVALTLALVLALAAAITRYVEKPAMRAIRASWRQPRAAAVVE